MLRKKTSKDGKQPPSPNDPYDRIFESGSPFPRTPVAAVVAANAGKSSKKDGKKDSGGKSPKSSQSEFSRRSWLGETGVYGNVNNVAHGAATAVNRPLREIDCFRQFCDETSSSDAASSSKGPGKELRLRKAPILNRRADKNKSPTSPNRRTPFVEKYADATYGKPSRFGNDLLGPPT